jgi:hypothetical protein
VDAKKLMPCYFGQALKRIINWAVAACKHIPHKKIFATKLDIKAAYRRCHLHVSTTVHTCTQLPSFELALMLLRFPLEESVAQQNGDQLQNLSVTS